MNEFAFTHEGNHIKFTLQPGEVLVETWTLRPGTDPAEYDYSSAPYIKLPF